MTFTTKFRDRREAGRQLGDVLASYARFDPIVLALPRGGVPVGYEVARACGAPLDVCVARKVSVPWHPELGLGAVAEGGQVYLSHEMLSMLGLSPDELSTAIEREQREVEARVLRYRGGRPRIDVRGRAVLLVDDGIATGGTAMAALQSLRADEPSRIIVAAPVAPMDTAAEFGAVADGVVTLSTPRRLIAIGNWYEDFTQVSDEEVLELLERARRERAPSQQSALEPRS